MLYAIDKTNQKIEPSPNIVGICPYCKEELIPKCGPINIWHFSHKSKTNCDPWSYGETDWHRIWKTRFVKNNTEVFLKINTECHFADFYSNISHTTIEFQNSPLSLVERFAREMFYPNLNWIVHYTGNGLSHKVEYTDGDIEFRWLHPLKWVTTNPNPKCNYFLDDDSGFLFYIKNISHKKFWEHNSFGFKKQHHIIIKGRYIKYEDLVRYFDVDSIIQLHMTLKEYLNY